MKILYDSYCVKISEIVIVIITRTIKIIIKFFGFVCLFQSRMPTIPFSIFSLLKEEATLKFESVNPIYGGYFKGLF